MNQSITSETVKHAAQAGRRSRRQRGQALVESVLTLTAFLAIFMGMIEVGEILYIHQTLVERTRSAVRWGAVNVWDSTNSPTQISNVVLYGTPTPADNATPIFGLSSSNVSVTRPQPDYSSADRVVVSVSGYTLTFFTNAIVQLSGGNNSANAQFTGLTIQQSQTYEVSNGSSH